MALLLLLERHGRMTARQIATELEVSVRTVHRDIEALSAWGVPVYAERGAAGGFRLLEGYAPRLGGFTPDELTALRLLALPAVAEDLGWRREVSAAAIKLRLALPERQRGLIDASERLLLVDLSPAERDPATTDALRALFSAARQRRVLQLAFRDPALMPARFEPLGLVRTGSGWHCVGRLNGALAPVEVAGIATIGSTPDRFPGLPAFDLDREWQRLRREG